METKSTQERIAAKNKKSKNGTMSFLDHLDELRRRLIRYFIFLTICVLAAYAFRTEILNLVRKPVDAPLKKYTVSKTQNQIAPDSPISSLNSYNCSCQEVQIQPEGAVVKAEENKPAESITPQPPKTATPASEALTIGSALAVVSSSIDAVKEAINDFVVFFQVSIGKEPAPIFETEKYTQSTKSSPATQATQSLKAQLQLSCQCTLASDAEKSSDPHSSMVFIGLPELFFAQMKVAIFAGFFLSFPFLLIELWGFVGPALYRGEKKVFWIFAISSYIFFIGGALFGYFVVFPYGFDFFLSLTQMGEIMPSLSIGEYLGFAVKLLLAFGFIFELPLVTFILARMGIVTPELMIKQGRVAIVAIFIISALLTPPDPFTMILMAGPLLLLYILSIGVCFVGLNRQKAALRQQGVDPDDFKE